MVVVVKHSAQHSHAATTASSSSATTAAAADMAAVANRPAVTSATAMAVSVPPRTGAGDVGLPPGAPRLPTVDVVVLHLHVPVPAAGPGGATVAAPAPSLQMCLRSLRDNAPWANGKVSVVYDRKSSLNKDFEGRFLTVR